VWRNEKMTYCRKIVSWERPLAEFLGTERLQPMRVWEKKGRLGD